MYKSRKQIGIIFFAPAMAFEVECRKAFWEDDGLQYARICQCIVEYRIFDSGEDQANV